MELPFNNHLDNGPSDALNADDEVAVKPRRIWQPPPGARCVACGGADIAGLPTYSVGSGLMLRPYADDALCRVCGHIAPPHYTVSGIPSPPAPLPAPLVPR